jgi:uncharacterized damage-inducible protein DinB
VKELPLSERKRLEVPKRAKKRRIARAVDFSSEEETNSRCTALVEEHVKRRTQRLLPSRR